MEKQDFMKTVGNMYDILITLKQEYDEEMDDNISFDYYARQKLNKLYQGAFDLIIEDERESKNTI